MEELATISGSVEWLTARCPEYQANGSLSRERAQNPQAAVSLSYLMNEAHSQAKGLR